MRELVDSHYKIAGHRLATSWTLIVIAALLAVLEVILVGRRQRRVEKIDRERRQFQGRVESAERALMRLMRAELIGLQLLSPYPDARFSGRASFGDREVTLDGWRGMIGHNWGAQHAERWIWMHAADFEEDAGAWFDGALGRIKLGPVTTPWIANGVLHLDGERHRLGGPGKARRTEVDERPDGATFTLPGDGMTVQGNVGAAREAFVGWVYADPDGSEHHTVNCSVSDMTLTVSTPGEGARTLTVAGGAAYELGMREQDHGMAIQPFSDG